MQGKIFNVVKCCNKVCMSCGEVATTEVNAGRYVQHVTLCDLCRDKLTSELVLFEQDEPEKPKRVVLTTSMSIMPNNCGECSLAWCNLPMNDDDTIAMKWMKKRHPQCRLEERI